MHSPSSNPPAVISAVTIPLRQSLPPSTCYQPPLVVLDEPQSQTDPLVDRLVLFFGGTAFGFACGINAAILVFAAVSKQQNALAWTFGIALSAVIAVNLWFRWQKQHR
tara:strand:- start:60953 stop:61276 length:324 start_codon:yes stop_codon:yes gene_type:complete